MTCEEFEEISGAYVLDAVTPEERAEARTHLAQCEKCTRLDQELRAVVALLPLSVTQIEPPAALKERIFAAIRQEGEPVPAQPTPITQRARRRRPGLLTQLLAAALVLLLVLFGSMAAFNISLQAQNASLAHQISVLQSQNSTLSGQVSSLRTQVANVLKTYNLAVISNVTKGATGQVIYIPEHNLAVLMMRGLPQLQGTQVYQGWLIQGGKPISIGLLSVQNGVATLNYSGTLAGSAEAAVSLEPGPFPSAKPTKVVAIGRL
jgi:cell division protein FtsB